MWKFPLFSIFLWYITNVTAESDWLAIEFSVSNETISHSGSLFTCIKLRLRPEESNKDFEMQPRVQHHISLPPGFETAQEECVKMGGAYARLNRLRAYANNAVSTKDEQSKCENDLSSSPSSSSSASLSSSPLGKAIASWNNRFYDMNTAKMRENTVRFHGRGTEGEHLAQEVSHFVMPKEVQARINQRLDEYYDLIFTDQGIGTGGTTGAHFLSGNVGFGNAAQGAGIMDIIFPHSSQTSGAAQEAEAALFDGDGYARNRGGGLLGEANTGRSDGWSSATDDARRFEAEVKRVIMERSDVQYFLGEQVDFQFQHRLWRYGPNFDPKAKGGIWHKDTCPFGINGALPEGSMMFTIVYILYTENLDGPTAGTRVRDKDGTIISLPCIAGEGNIIRSGESDDNAFFHSGPLNIRKLDPSRPAYRLMIQTKAVVRSSEWDHTYRAIPRKGNWRGLKVPPFPQVAEDHKGELEGLQAWLKHTSKVLTSGVGESNAVGFEAYPINVHRAWEVTRDLSTFLGFQAAGFLPEPDSAATPVVLIGFDERYTEGLVESLANNNFVPLIVASDGEFEELRSVRQDAYMNMNTIDIDDVEKVEAKLRNLPFDFHVLVDVPPRGPRALGGGEGMTTVLDRYGKVLGELAADGRGEGRLVSVTFLSQQMPFGGRDTAGGLRFASSAPGAPTPHATPWHLSPTQAAFLLLEQQWVAWGERWDVRVVVMRVADRVVASHDSALQFAYSGGKSATAEGGGNTSGGGGGGGASTAAADGEQTTRKKNPCRVEDVCGEHDPLTRIHAEDLWAVMVRMISMFDIVETRGADSSMRGTASLSSSIARFPSGTVLDVVDDGPSHSMAQAEHWAGLMMGKTNSCAPFPRDPLPTEPSSHRNAKGRNAELKDALGMPVLLYPSYHHGAAKLFGMQEF